jgi:hypothetical protein
MNVTISIPPGDYGSPEEVAQEVKRVFVEELENEINEIAERHRRRGPSW